MCHRMTAHRPGRRLRTGFTVIELAIVLILVGLLVVPLLRLAGVSFGSTRDGMTQIALETARDGLIAFAAANGGCLPFAADFEGGYPDTDATGASGGFVDTGSVITAPKTAGDVPWADLGLNSSFLDGDNLRIQYYVAVGYVDTDTSPPIACLAGFRGFQWKSDVTYVGTDANPVYVYHSLSAKDRWLYKIIGTLSQGTPPNTVPAVADELKFLLPASLLEVRRGPVINAASPQNDPISLQNVFVLIAPGNNTNADHNRRYFRDSNHRGDAGGSSWSPDSSNNLDLVVFSSTPNVDTTDAGNNGDDTILVMSFIQYKAELNKYGLNMEPMCDDLC